MAALVQSYPQQSSTVTMLQTRPSSASGILQTSSQTPSHHQYPANPTQRNSFHGINNGMGLSNYRGHTAVAPIAPYAFTSTPSLATPGQRTQGPHLRPDQRTSSAPAVTTMQPESGNPGSRSRYPAPASVSTTSSSSSSDLSSLGQISGSRDDSITTGTSRVPGGNPRPHSTIFTSSTSPNLASAARTAPDRYRRPNNRRAESSPNVQQSYAQQSNAQQASVASSMPNVMQFYGSSTTQQANSPMPPFQGFNLQMPELSRPAGKVSPAAGGASDDMLFNRHTSQDQAQRYRRRSIHTIDAGAHSGNPTSAGLIMQGSRQVSSANGRIDHQQHPLRSSPIVTVRPASSHGRNGSSESVNSTRSNSRPSSVSTPRKNILLTANNPIYPSPIKHAFHVISLTR
jgi:hypothetical protein